MEEYRSITGRSSDSKRYLELMSVTCLIEAGSDELIDWLWCQMIKEVDAQPGVHEESNPTPVVPIFLGTR